MAWIRVAQFLTLYIHSLLAFRTDFQALTQCTALNVTWTGNASPPFKFFIIPINSTDVQVVDIPDTDTTWNATSNSGSYVLPPFPLPAGTQYVATMDDGNGLGTGGVSSVQTISDSSSAGCLSTTPKISTSKLFTLSTTPRQCEDLSITWDPKTVADRVFIRGWIPGGNAFALDPPAAGANTTAWTVDISRETQIMLMFSTGGPEGQLTPLETTSLMIIEGSNLSSASCFRTGGPSVTMSIPAASTVESSTSTVPSFSSIAQAGAPEKGVNIPVIIGGSTGGLAIVVLVIFLLYYVRRRAHHERLNSDMDPITSLNARPRPLVLPSPEGSPIMAYASPERRSASLPPATSQQKQTSRNRQSSQTSPPSSRRHSATLASGSSSLPSPSATSTGAPPRSSGRRTSRSSIVQQNDNELPEFIRHRDAGPVANTLQSSRIVELPPLYEDAAPRSRNRPLPQPKT